VIRLPAAALPLLAILIAIVAGAGRIAPLVIPTQANACPTERFSAAVEADVACFKLIVAPSNMILFRRVRHPRLVHLFRSLPRQIL
jgi:hypothetical protein